MHLHRQFLVEYKGEVYEQYEDLIAIGKAGGHE
jgi:hypothetical protein